MTRYFCDRCGKEAEKLTEIKIPSRKNNFGSFETKSLSVCRDCKKEFDDIIDKLVDIRFILFGTFMTNN